MISIVFYNLSRGTGQTTLAVNLAWHLYRQHARRILLVDLDPQFGATQALMSVERYDDHRSKYGTVTDILLETPEAGRLSSKIMYPVEIAPDKRSFLLLLPGEAELFQVEQNPAGVDLRLRQQLRAWEQNFDFIFIDAPTSVGILATAGLLAAEAVIVPVRPERYSVLSYTIALQAMKQVAESHPEVKAAHDLGVVFSRTPKKADELEEGCYAFIREHASYCFKTEVPETRGGLLKDVHGRGASPDTHYALALPEPSIAELAIEMDQRIRALWPILKSKR